jgi:hypothetical protein
MHNRARTHVQIAKDLSPSIGTYERQPASDLRYPSLTCLDTADARKELRGLLVQVEGAGLRLGSTGTLCGKRRCQRICARRSSAARRELSPIMQGIREDQRLQVMALEPALDVR